ncbi:MAG: tetratricopeptide repeat protein [Verrucomicrobiae bacterium]|nr:tetratricopeptide repeat protein [Verrucomicrobiae bacterium]
MFCLLAVVGCVIDSAAQDEGGTVSVEATLTASELLQAGSEAFDRQNFAGAEQAWQQLETDFGESEEVKAELLWVRPLLAIAKVAKGEFVEALGLIEASLALAATIPNEIVEQLRFWHGVCLLKAERFVDAQHAFGGFYADESHDYERRMEAMILFGMAYIMQGEFSEANAFFADRVTKLKPGKDSETRGRIAVLQLHALMQAGAHDAALVHLKDWYPKMSEITQLAAFQSLALQLGAHFLDAQAYYKSIEALQRIWPRERLLKHQRGRLLDLEARHTGMKLRKASQDSVYKIEGMITRVRREIENFEEISNFDSALRLRLAMAYQGLERFREAGLVLEDMLGRMADDPIVEQASVRLVQNWMQVQRWDKAVEAADGYVSRFGPEGTENLPTVLFLRADALKSAAKYEQAIGAFAALIEQFPKSDMVPKCRFMTGVCWLNAGDHLKAVAAFKEVQKQHPKHALCEDADYWTGMAWSFEQEHQRCRDHLKNHLRRYAKGRYRGDAEFRRAFCLFAMGAYPGAVEGMRKFAVDHPESGYVDESRLLLGDALGAVGEIDAAIAAYRSVTVQSPRYYEDGQFKIGKALRLTSHHARLRKHFGDFIAQHPSSPRIVEAVYWIGWSHMAEEDVEEARRIYWETIDKHGDDPAIVAVEDILLALPKLYPGDARRELGDALRNLSGEAQNAKRTTLLARIAWAEGQFAQARGSEVSQMAESALLRAARLLDPKVHSARMLADCADARFRAGQLQLAADLYSGLRRWNPRAVEKERAYLGLGRIAQAQEDSAAALEWFGRAAKVAVSRDTIAEALLAKAELEVSLGKHADARSTLDGLLGSQYVDGRSKAQGLLAYGRALEAGGDRLKATAYYQRVYVAYGKHLDLVARAYLARGRALEALSEKEKALEVYQELAARADLEAFDASRDVLGRIKVLSGQGSEGTEVVQ